MMVTGEAFTSTAPTPAPASTTGDFRELDGRPQVSITTIAGCPAAEEARKG